MQISTRTAFPASDRLEIMDLFARYAWGRDTGSYADMTALFTETAVVTSQDGVRFEGRAAINEFWKSAVEPDKGVAIRGTQHHTGNLLIEGDGSRCNVQCYWFTLRWEPSTGERFLKAQGYYKDVCVKVNGLWFFEERAINLWNGDSLPWRGP